MSTQDADFISPSDFMRARRPELFSDTISSEEEYLDKGQLEYHLSTLTQRQQEFQFEHFCRRLAERELCPNLVPQTGPMGGGDAKVDTETHPVSEELSRRWYEGDPKAAKERWGFAISAKEKWRPKVKSDVEKIVNTKRGYTLIYFMTNQAVSSKKRADLEDELKAQWGTSVRILDRTWIVEKITQNRRWDVVFSTLEIDHPRTQERKHHGPYDAERLQELEELESLIDDPNRYQDSEYQLIEDCLQTAIIARGLNHPRTEIDGRFDRAERIAHEQGSKRQLFRVLYQKAWTAYWWFDDYQELDRLYDKAEELMIDADWTWDLEKLVNLWTAGRTWLFMQKKPIDSDKWGGRTIALHDALMKHAMDSTRRTNALWARTQLVLMDLNNAAANREGLPAIWKLMAGILREAEGLLDYPVGALVQIVQDIGAVAEDCDEYDDLLEMAIEVQSKRVGKAKQGQMRLDFGLKKLKRGKPYEAIEQYGKAQTLLGQNEYLKEFVESLLGTASGYEAVGLLWAARANLIQAFERTTNEYLKDGIIGYAAFPLVRRLIWIEIQLGRIPCVLGWLNWLGIISHTVELDEESKEKLGQEFIQMDAILGILTLQTDFDSWNELSHVAGLFDRFQLYMSRAAVLFSMGYDELYREEFNQPEENLDEFFSQWLVQPANEDLPDRAEWMLYDPVRMHTSIIGCKVELRAQSNLTSIVLGETILAFLESFMASTIKMDEVFSTRSQIYIDINQSPKSEPSFSYNIEEDEFGESKIKISHMDISPDSIVSDSTYKDNLFRLLADLIGQLHIQISKEKLELLFSEERAQDRAILAATMPIALCNVAGTNPRYLIKEWIDSAPEERLHLKRETPWSPLSPDLTSGNKKDPLTPIKFAKGPPPPEAFDRDKAKHSDIEISSIINIPLWDKAQWSGTGFVQWPGTSPIPGLMIAFKNIESGEKIFHGWRRSIDDRDLDELVDVTIVKGISKSHPAHYRVVIGANLEHQLSKGKGDSQIMLINRQNTMEPSNSTNLDNFLEAFAEQGQYYFHPGPFPPTGHGAPCSTDCILTKSQLRIVSAWKIGPNDPVITALQLSDDPIIPSGVDDPPCAAAFDFIKGLRNNS